MDYADKLTPKPVVHFYAAAPVHNPAAVDNWCLLHGIMVEPHVWDGRLVMKTTLDLNDQVLRQAKSRAAREGITLTKFVEDALRARLAAGRDGKAPFRMRLITVKGDRPPNVDISDRDALYDVIDRP